jgi:hypothetical protein
MLQLSVLAATMLVSGAPADANYPTRDVGSWVVSASSDKQGCFLTRNYQGRRATTLQFGLDVDGSHRLTILNANWSVGEKEQLRLNFRLSNAFFPRHLAIGIAAEGKKGFVTSFGAAFPGNFAASEFIHIARGDVPVDDLDLGGSGAAIAELRRCVDHYRSGRAVGPSVDEDARRIPIDPFARQSKSTSKK